ncbi:hypothetical protein QJU43_01195 [Pasteurella atlantica]|uniref:Uncharacterized protein n=2 Tax=Pasteurellaceae TaxID=712 RepID=A0ACC6HPQ9_9PAST|nr:hypothetical protein [Pasteurella atlantica]MDP8032909.1 hypothetical protein [Pasteurella atlantica]MDP8034934.1 hypothetical protein [Pasteurella atlantica]MDP8036796.1 hypothetical protein [Pasteurella atlantica]MDP8047231.1 hypothetical protein [Pasteurella atlantica]MDP8049259.1 hypothetical protein [Pasteurella atlantica]
MKLIKLLIVGIVALNISACSSIITLEHPCPYGGTRANALIVKNCLTDPPKNTTGFGDIVCKLTVPAIIDFPLSLAVDTALFPIQGIRYLANDNKCTLFR